MRFVDNAKITVCSGKGGDGAATFRREKYIEFGGPDGGNGGKGGDVFVLGNASLNTLLDYRYTRVFKAENGENGQKRACAGRAGKDVIIQVPIGTQVWDEDKSFLIVDITKHGQKVLLAKGGHGGCGNVHFKSSVERTPQMFSPGEPGQELVINFSLKLLANVGLVGKPNAGKSSLLRQLSNSKTKVGDYPFTTIHPHLGVLVDSFRTVMIADIPGIIHGASQGIGLGQSFLAHIERCDLLVYILDGSESNIIKEYKLLQQELVTYSKKLINKPKMIVINKIDLLSPQQLIEKQQHLQSFLQSENVPFVIYKVSCAAYEANMPELQGEMIDFTEALLNYKDFISSHSASSHPSLSQDSISTSSAPTTSSSESVVTNNKWHPLQTERQEIKRGIGANLKSREK